MKNKIFISVFLLLSIMLYPAYRLTYSLWDHTNYENRNYTMFSDVKNASLSDKSKSFDNFINDNAPFKNEFTSLNAGINYKIFSMIQSSQVLLGKEGWLFLKNDNDSTSLDDYQGLNQYAEEQKEDLLNKLIYLNDVLRSKGITFKVIVAPNKEQVYKRYMPDSIPVEGRSRVDVISEYITSNSDLDYVYPNEYFQQISQDNDIYYRYDTHWNNLGAAYGTALLFPELSDFVATKTEQEPLFDQAKISGIYNYVPMDSYYHISCDVKQSDQKLYLLHDSFGAMMLPILSQEFSVSDATFAYFSDFDIPEDTDIFVIEINERYFYRLFDTIDRIIVNAETK